MYNLSVYGEQPGDSVTLIELIRDALKHGYKIEVVKIDKIES